MPPVSSLSYFYVKSFGLKVIAQDESRADRPGRHPVPGTVRRAAGWNDGGRRPAEG